MKKRLIALLCTLSLLLTTVTTTVSTVSTQEPEMRLVNTSDALEILKCIVKLIDPLPLDPCDFNGNGEIDTGDALEVLKSIVKLIDPPLMIRVNLSSGCSDCGEIVCTCSTDNDCLDCKKNPCECEELDYIEHYLFTEVEYDTASGIVAISWESTVPRGSFEILYLPHGEDEYETLATVRNATSYEFQTNGEDFVVTHFKVIQTFGENVIESDTQPVIWSPDGVCWTEYTREWSVEVDDELLSEINDDNEFFQMSVEIVAAGVPELHLEITESSYSHAMQNDMMLGIIPELEYPEDLTVESITVRFAIADEHLDNALGIYTDHPEFIGIRRLNVFKWFDEVNMSLPIETLFDGDTLYVELDEVGTFCVMDMEKWFAMLEEYAGEEEEEEVVEEIQASTPSEVSEKMGFITIKGENYCTSLTGLSLGIAGLKNDDIVPLKYMTNLRMLSLTDNQISDLTPLSGLVNLERLTLARNGIIDLTPLSGLTNLELLELAFNGISDLTPLSGLTNLQELGLNYNVITDLTPLSGLVNLQKLSLIENYVGNVKPLGDLINLRTLHINRNPVSDGQMLGLRKALELANLRQSWNLYGRALGIYRVQFRFEDVIRVLEARKHIALNRDESFNGIVVRPVEVEVADIEEQIKEVRDKFREMGLCGYCFKHIESNQCICNNPLFRLGYVRNCEAIGIADALEILKYLVKMDGVLMKLYG